VRDSFYITTPIYYVNGSPHIGHAYTTVAADVAARWQRLRGRPVRFLTGTDEHGQKVLEAAEKRGMSPQAHVDDVVVEWKAMMTELGVQYDRFIRTTDADHKAVVQASLAKLHAKGDIYFAEYEGWYLVKDEVFITEKERADRIASGELTEEHFRKFSEANWFFKMGSYQGALITHLEATPDTVLPANRRNEVLGFLRKPLGDLCISRPKSRMSWGIEIPFAPDYVTYVWFDALLNYLTGAGWHPDAPAPDWESWWPANFQLLGKDILTTHAVYWTTMLLALDVPLPQHLLAHGWWVSDDGAKMSKSFGNVINTSLLCRSYGVDATRYFFLRQIAFGADGNFSYDAFQTRYNSDLANDLGNLLHRGTSMTTNWLGGVVPERPAPDAALLARASETVQIAADGYEKLQFQRALEAISELVGSGNKHVDTREPWALNKRGDADALRAVQRDTLELCALAGALLLPVMPTKAAELLGRVGLDEAGAAGLLAAALRGDGVLNGLRAGAPVTVGDPLFPRFREQPPEIAAMLEAAAAAPPPEKAPKPSKKPAPAAKPVETPLSETPATPEAEKPATIQFEDFSKVQLRTGKVLEAAVHPNGDKLLVLTVDVGEARPRTICAGIRSKFAPEDLVGRTVVVVMNLAPRKMRGVVSEGMILAAGGENVVGLVTVDAGPGEIVR
jgi:methionyl-tRNA synthetase